MSGKPHRVRVRLAADVADTLRQCAQQAAHHERGGLLLGWCNNGDIVFRRAVEVPDPTATSTTWTRHQHAAQQTLDQARAELGDPRIGYVGDWHTHPCGSGSAPPTKRPCAEPPGSTPSRPPSPSRCPTALPDGSSMHVRPMPASFSSPM